MCNNHINTNGSAVFAYDASGNMNQDAIPGVVYSFDAENRMYKVAGVTGGPYCYLYDGNGLRVAKKSGAASDCTGGTVVELYWRGLSGDALAESDGGWNSPDFRKRFWVAHPCGFGLRKGGAAVR